MILCFRCTAFPDNLDGDGAPRSQRLADALGDAFSFVELWSEWGMDTEIKVWKLSCQLAELHSLFLAIH